MLATRGQAQFLARRGAELQDPLGQPLRVEQFARVGDARHLLSMRVAGILCVEPAQGGLEEVRVPGFEYLSHCLGLIAKVR